MLQFMRKHAKFFYIFFFLVIISFIFFYVGPIDRSSTMPIIEIGDNEIYPDEYWRTYDNLRNYYRDVYQDKFDAEMEKSLNLKDRTLDILLTNELLFLAARILDVTVINEELTDSIVNEPAFIRDGVFRKDVYLRVLKFSRMTPQFYEAKRKKELIIQKVRRLIEHTAIVDDIKLPDELGKDEKALETLRQTLIRGEKERTVRAYIEAMKEIIPVKIHYELIA